MELILKFLFQMGVKYRPYYLSYFCSHATGLKWACSFILSFSSPHEQQHMVGVHIFTLRCENVYFQCVNFKKHNFWNLYVGFCIFKTIIYVIHSHWLLSTLVTDFLMSTKIITLVFGPCPLETSLPTDFSHLNISTHWAGHH